MLDVKLGTKPLRMEILELQLPLFQIRHGGKSSEGGGGGGGGGLCVCQVWRPSEDFASLCG